MHLFQSSTSPDIVALFGSGVVGSSILQELLKNGYNLACTHAFDWSSVREQRNSIPGIVQCLRSLDTAANVHICWAAGRAGFGAGEGETSCEFSSFESVLLFAHELARRNHAVFFHMISSAGGLFEGRVGVDSHTAPQPRSAYGRLKLRQEVAAQAMAGIEVQIYRPSTIYGFGGPSARMGLVAALLANTAAHAVTNLYGKSDTLRDYVFADDIGRFVTDRIANSGSGSAHHILASGKATSLGEIVRLVEIEYGIKAYVQYSIAPTNISNNSYRPSALPAGFNVTDLPTGIRLTSRKIVHNTVQAGV